MWKQRRFTNFARYFLDDWLPPVIRENRTLNKVLARLFHGKHFDLDFKRKAPYLSDAEFARAYDLVSGSGVRDRYRLTDMSEAQIEWVVRHVVGNQVLEVGCGHGVLAKALAEKGGLQVTATELSDQSLEHAREYLKDSPSPVTLTVGNLERLPFADKSFDTTICAHLLEHVVRFDKAVAELARVTRRRLLVVVPCQRFYRYTIDYHVHFFPEPEQFVLRMGFPNSQCEKVTGDLCYLVDFEP